MPTVASIDVSLVAKAGRFVKGIDRAKAAVGGFARKIPGLNMALSKTGAIASGLAGGALVFMANRQAKLIDANAKLADRIGITTQGLIGLQHAADQTGAGANLLNNSLGAMTKRIGEAAAGFGSGKVALELLNLEAEELIGLPVDDQLKKIAEAYKGLNTQQEKAAAASGLFSRAGLKLGNLLETGKEGIEAYRAEVEELGLAYTRVDAAKVEAANDALDKAGKVIQGALQQAVIKLAPYVEAISDAFTDWATEGEGMGAKVLKVIEWITLGVTKLTDVWKILRGGVKIFGAVVLEVLSAAAKLVVDFADTALEVVDFLTFGLTDLGDALDDASNFLQAFNDEAGKTREEGVKLIESGFAGDASKEAAAFFDGIERKADAAAEKIAEGAEAQQDAARGAAEQAAALEAVNQQLEEEERKLKEIDDTRAKEAERITEKLATEGRILEMTKEERRWSSEILEIEKARGLGLDDLAGKLERILNRKAEEALAEERLLKLERQRVDEARKLEEAARLAEAKREGELQYMEELVRQLRIQEAGNDTERERIRLIHERQDALDRAGDNAVNQALVERFYEQKLAELEEDRLKTAQETAKAIGEQATAAQEVLKTTSKAAEGAGQRQVGGFVAAGSSGMFGMTGQASGLQAFGAVNVKPVRNDALRAKQRREAQERLTVDPFVSGAEEVASGATGSEAVPNVGPEVDKARAAVEDMADSYGELAEDIQELTGEVTDAAGEVAATTSKTATVLQQTATKLNQVAEQQARLQDTLSAIQASLSGSP